MAAKALAEHALQLIHPTLELTALEGGPVRVVAHNEAMLRQLCQHTNGSPTAFEGQFIAARTVQMSLRGILTQCCDHSLCTRAVDSETPCIRPGDLDVTKKPIVTSRQREGHRAQNHPICAANHDPSAAINGVPNKSPGQHTRARRREPSNRAAPDRTLSELKQKVSSRRHNPSLQRGGLGSLALEINYNIN